MRGAPRGGPLTLRVTSRSGVVTAAVRRQGLTVRHPLDKLVRVDLSSSRGLQRYRSLGLDRMVKGIAVEDAGWLFGIYGALLTDRQQEVCRLVLDEDWSLAEVASALDVSRAAVSDMVQRSLRQMTGWEQKLGVLRGIRSRQAVLDEMARTLDECPPTVRDQLLSLMSRLSGPEGQEAMTGHV